MLLRAFENPLICCKQIRRDGAIGLSAVPMKPSKLPSPQPVIAVYWMPSQGGKVHYRESSGKTQILSFFIPFSWIYK